MAKDKLTLSIVIPVYNERDTILSILEAVESVALAGIEKEIVIVDDHSTDDTRELLAQISETRRFRLICHERNRGKGSALRTGFSAASGDIVLVQDADLEHNPAE